MAIQFQYHVSVIEHIDEHNLNIMSLLCKTDLPYNCSKIAGRRPMPKNDATTWQQSFTRQLLP